MACLLVRQSGCSVCSRTLSPAAEPRCGKSHQRELKQTCFAAAVMINPEATSRTRDGACVLARNSIGIDAGYHDAVAGTEVFARRCDGEPVRKINLFRIL